MLVTVDDVQLLAAHERQHLTHRRLAGACVSHQQRRLTVLHTPEGRQALQQQPLHRLFS